jgi:DNA-directed RNA polymerase subunit alpha
MTDYDRLILEIVTDGTIEPDDALSRAAQILVEHARLIADFNRQDAIAVEEAARQPSAADNRPLSELGLSPRVLNALRSRHIERVGQVLDMEPEQLLSIRNFGPRSLQELKERLEEFGYTLEMPTGFGPGESARAEDDDSGDADAVAASPVEETEE